MFRRRAEIDAAGREVESQVTLKFRHPDRYLSQDRNMDAAEPDEDVKAKLEEDIKAPFVPLFSHSTTQPVHLAEKLEKMQDVQRLYPGIKKDVAGYRRNTAITTVAGFTAKELVITGREDNDARFKIRRNPKIDTECAVIIWYDMAISETRPAVVEFSFRYGDEREKYTAKMGQRAHDAFQCLQQQLGDWVDPNSLTKTAYVYSRLDNISN